MLYLNFGEESLRSLSREQFRMEIPKELVGQAVVLFRAAKLETPSEKICTLTRKYLRTPPNNCKIKL